MVILPIGFVATKYVGYFWHMKEKKLYSLKQGGMLRELKHHEPNWFNKWKQGGYQVSVKGRRRILWDDYLNNLKPEDSEIPIMQKVEKKDEQKYSARVDRRRRESRNSHPLC